MAKQHGEPSLANGAAPIWPDRLCDEITRALPHDGILVADTGYSGIWSSTLIELNGEGQTYLRAAGSLGWSFPAALGAKCAAPRRKVICWSGDGAIYYHLTELETAKRRGIAVVLVINNNSGFGQGWPNIQRQQGNKPGDVRELVRFGPTNFADVARVFGLRGIRVEDPSQIAPALKGRAGIRRNRGRRCRDRYRLPCARALVARLGVNAATANARRISGPRAADAEGDRRSPG